MASDVKRSYGVMVADTTLTAPFTQTFTIPSLGWTPKACKIYAFGAETEGATPTDDIRASFGFSDGTNQACIGYHCQAGTPIETGRYGSNTRAIVQLMHSGDLPIVDTLGSVTGFVQDGVTIQWSDSTGTASAPTYGIHYVVEFFGGDDYSGEVITDTVSLVDTGTLVVNTSGSPDLIEALLPLANPDTPTEGAAFMYGAASSLTDTFFYSERYIHDQATTQPSCAQFSGDGGLVAAHNAYTSLNWRINLTSLDASSFTLTTEALTGPPNAATDDIFMLVHSFAGDHKVKVGIATPPVSQVDWVETGLGFTPGFISFIASPALEATNVFILGSLGDSFGLGVTDFSNSHTVVAGEMDNQSASSARSWTLDGSLAIYSSPDSVRFDYTSTPIQDLDGFTVPQPHDTVTASQRYWPYIAFEDTAVAPATATASLSTYSVDTILNLIKYSCNKLYLVPAANLSELHTVINTIKIAEFNIDSSDFSDPEDDPSNPGFRRLRLVSPLSDGLALRPYNTGADTALVLGSVDGNNANINYVWAWVDQTFTGTTQAGDTVQITSDLVVASISLEGTKAV